MPRDPYDRWKRAIDLVLASVGLVVTAPLQLLVAIAVRRKLGSPVLFRQQRPGKDEQIFELVKFRTMLNSEPSTGLVTDEERMTRLGALLRSTSLDELPTLWNVVKGDMSLVGPRPLLVRYLTRYNDDQRKRHRVRPGVTGLAQVSGRNAITWDEKFARDLEYVDNMSLILDARIVFRTIKQVVRRAGITAAGDATMPEFVNPRDATEGDCEPR